MSRILSLAVALLFAPAADALNLNNYHQNNFQQAKTFAAAINADAPGSFTVAVRFSGREKGDSRSQQLWLSGAQKRQSRRTH